MPGEKGDAGGPQKQIHNGDAGRHRQITPGGPACFPKQEEEEDEEEEEEDEDEEEEEEEEEESDAENSIQREESAGPRGHGLKPRAGEDSEKEKEDGLSTPHKKSGRRKLARPTKCKLVFTGWIVFLLVPDCCFIQYNSCG